MNGVPSGGGLGSSIAVPTPGWSRIALSVDLGTPVATAKLTVNGAIGYDGSLTFTYGPTRPLLRAGIDYAGQEAPRSRSISTNVCVRITP